MHMRVALEHHQLVDLDGPRTTYASKIVAFEIDQHYVLGAFLRMRE